MGIQMIPKEIEMMVETKAYIYVGKKGVTRSIHMCYHLRKYALLII